MDPLTIFSAMTAFLLFLFFCGIPIFVSFLLCNLIGLLLLTGSAGVGLFVNSITHTATTSALVTVPFFILMGDILYRAQTVGSLIKAIDTLVGRLRGRHYYLSIGVSTVLATLSGSVLASSAMLCRTVYPVMRNKRYDRPMALGVIIGGACLAPIIPPSIMAILIATIAQISIAELFIAGIIPGILISSLFVIYISIRVFINPDLAPEDNDYVRPSAGQVLSAIFNLVPFTLIVGLVTGSIMFGIATPTESAAVGIFCAVVAAALYGQISARMLLDALRSTAMITAMIMAIMVSSQLFSQIISFSGTASTLRHLVNSLDLSPGLMLFILMAIPFVICMFIDEMAAMLILIPIYAPLLGPLDFHPVWFWTLFLINMTLGAIVPPVGYVLFVMKGALPEVQLVDLFRASIPYVALFVLAMFLMGAFPQIVLFPLM